MNLNIAFRCRFSTTSEFYTRRSRANEKNKKTLKLRKKFYFDDRLDESNLIWSKTSFYLRSKQNLALLSTGFND